MYEVVAPPSVPIGKIKSFGPFGPKYEVGQVLYQLDDGDWMIEMRLFFLWPALPCCCTFNRRPLSQSKLRYQIGHVPPAEAEEAYYRQQASQAKAA